MNVGIYPSTASQAFLEFPSYDSEHEHTESSCSCVGEARSWYEKLPSMTGSSSRRPPRCNRCLARDGTELPGGAQYPRGAEERWPEPLPKPWLAGSWGVCRLSHVKESRPERLLGRAMSSTCSTPSVGEAPQDPELDHRAYVSGGHGTPGRNTVFTPPPVPLLPSPLERRTVRLANRDGAAMEIPPSDASTSALAHWPRGTAGAMRLNPSARAVSSRKRLSAQGNNLTKYWGPPQPKAPTSVDAQETDCAGGRGAPSNEDGGNGGSETRDGPSTVAEEGAQCRDVVGTPGAGARGSRRGSKVRALAVASLPEGSYREIISATRGWH